eukprot:CCRYP_002948-RA/>CCRYP_002948-RA protein AED:0.43 eAED:0.43 QI:0/-1/0/1/-1/0/1/0/108
MINSVLSRRNAKFCTFNISNFYLGTPLDRPEYNRIRINDIPQEFIDKYDLTHHVRDDWVYFQIVKGVYGLPQSARQATFPRGSFWRAKLMTSDNFGIFFSHLTTFTII